MKSTKNHHKKALENLIESLEDLETAFKKEHFTEAASHIAISKEYARRELEFADCLQRVEDCFRV